MYENLLKIHSGFIGYSFKNSENSFIISEKIDIISIIKQLFCREILEVPAPNSRKERVDFLISLLSMAYIEHFNINLNDSYDYFIEY